MAKDQDNIRIYGSEDDTVWLAPLGTTLPTGLAAPGAGFEDVGYLGESGIDLTRDDSVQQFRAHQGGKVVRKKITESSTSFVFRTLEDNETTAKLADNVISSSTATGVTTSVLSSAREVQAYACVVDKFDAGIHERHVIARLEVAGGGTETWSNSELTEREFTGEVIGNFTKIVGPAA
ncbi:phage tail tube protein [Oerskovia enterophila]|uniref:phage tail tube protein n=1 Tax=Oerskovia enterophila TaxID=43678 RepID=UPI003814E6E9